MKLLELSYKDRNWELNNLQLGDVNLIVGKNAVGKSRTLLFIDLLYKIITQKRNLSWGSTWNINFKNSQEEILNYQFRTNNKKEVIFEKIKVGREIVLSRKQKDEASLKSETFNLLRLLMIAF